VYKNKPVEKEVLERILDTCRHAPTGSNMQQVKWIVTHDKAKIQSLGNLVVAWMKQAVETGHPLAAKLPLAGVVAAWEKGDDRLFRGAPVLVMNHGPKAGSLPLESCVIGLTFFDLIAFANGIGTCWVGLLMVAAANHPPILEALGIPDENKLYGAMLAGYPKFSYQRIPTRNSIDINWL
jgi:nitroreductase